MSMTALLKGTRDYLRTQTGDVLALTIDIHPDGRPSPKMGRWYLSLFAKSSQHVATRDPAKKKGETYTIGATLTTKFNAPRDRQGTVLTAEDVGLTDLSERFADLIHGKYPILTAANTYLTEPENGPFAEVLEWTNTSYGEKDNSWVWSTLGGESILYVAEMTFTGGKRVRAI